MMQAILSSDQTHPLKHTFYDPGQTPKATLLIVHGMAEHSGRYETFAQYLAERGIAVLTYDQLGHGHSVNTADELGYFHRSRAVEILLGDVMIMAKSLHERHPNAAHFIMGHSMGSFITRNVLQKHSKVFDGAILMGTSDFNPLVNIILPLTKLLNHLRPHKPNAALSRASNKLFNHKLPEDDVKSEFAWVLKDPQALNVYEADPLTGFDFTNNGYFAVFKLMQSGLAKNWAKNKIAKNFPMLLVSGQEDPVGDMGRGITTLCERLRKQGFLHVQTKLYTDMRHEVLHEKNHTMVFADILNWLEAQMTRGVNGRGTTDK